MATKGKARVTLAKLGQLREKHNSLVKLVRNIPANEIRKKLRIVENDIKYYLTRAKKLGLECKVEVLLAKTELRVAESERQ